MSTEKKNHADDVRMREKVYICHEKIAQNEFGIKSSFSFNWQFIYYWHGYLRSTCLFNVANTSFGQRFLRLDQWEIPQLHREKVNKKSRPSFFPFWSIVSLSINANLIRDYLGIIEIYSVPKAGGNKKRWNNHHNCRACAFLRLNPDFWSFNSITTIC